MTSNLFCNCPKAFLYNTVPQWSGLNIGLPWTNDSLTWIVYLRTFSMLIILAHHS